MPELPEVETTLRGIAPLVSGKCVREVIIRQTKLRQPVTPSLVDIAGRRFTSASRRGKYLLFGLDDSSSLLIHLGMSGSLRSTDSGEIWKIHDHLALGIEDGRDIRFHDPRRFGLVLHLTTGEPLDHPLLRDLGPEPLDAGFTASSLHAAFARRSAPVKTVIMDHHVVVGVGNIYASEALFLARIHPHTPASGISLRKTAALVEAIRTVLQDAIAAGGTTLRDFSNSDGKPGYFQRSLAVYGRAGEPCIRCGTAIARAVTGQRSTYWCPRCQRAGR